MSTAAGGIATVVEDGQTGVIVPERDARALAAALGGLIQDPHRGASLGQAGRALVQGRFGWESAAARFEAAYDRALAFNSLTR